MADTPVEVHMKPGRTSHSLYLYGVGSDVLGNAGGDVLTEATNAKGVYTAIVADSLVGNYNAVVKDSGGTTRAVFRVELADTEDLCTCEEPSTALRADSLPVNFGALAINESGHVARVVLVDTTTANSDMRGTNGANTTTPPTAAAIATAVWDAICETGLSFRKALRRILATTAGKEADDSSSTNRKYLSPNESKTRVDATISGGRRSAMTYDDDDET